MSMPAPSVPASAGGGIPASFEQAYRDYAETTARWVQQLGGASVDVDDVVQEVFLVVSRKLGRFRGDSRFSTWLFEVTRKITANHRRRQRWRFWRTGSPRARDSSLPDNPTPEAELERRQTIALLYRALDKLPERYRTVLVLYELEGMSSQEIADLRQLNLSTVRVQLGRARQRFMKHYRRLLKKEPS